MNKLLIFTILYLLSIKISAQQPELHTVLSYPQGYYNSLEDFLAKKVVPFDSILRMDVKTRRFIAEEETVDQVYFASIADSSILKKVFAVSYRGQLYFRQAYFTKYASKGDRVDAAANPRSYHRVLMDGNFFYMEAVFANTWKTGLGYNMGAVGSAMASSAFQLKPIIFNFETKLFDLFRNCKDLNSFLASRKSPTALDCEKRHLSLADAKAVLKAEISR